MAIDAETKLYFKNLLAQQLTQHLKAMSKMVSDKMNTLEVHLNGINELKFKLLEKDIVALTKELQQEIDKNISQHKEYYTAVNTVDSRIADANTTIMKDLGSNRYNNLTLVLSGLAVVGMVVFGVLTLL